MDRATSANSAKYLLIACEIDSTFGLFLPLAPPGSGTLCTKFSKSDLIEMSVWAVRSFHVFGKKCIRPCFLPLRIEFFEVPPNSRLLAI